MLQTVPFQSWHHRTETAERAPVFPDGCRDVLIVRQTGCRKSVVLTELDLRPRVAALAAGTEITGYRLRPGAVIGEDVLAELERGGRAEEVLGNALMASQASGAAAEEIILALVAPGATVERVAGDLGVSRRTLQRQLKAAALPPPDYWRLLARARRAAGMLAAGAALTEIADLCGFSDQAHMTRDLRTWFGGTPAQLRRAPHILELLCQPALGNWTGEQISTR